MTTGRRPSHKCVLAVSLVAMAVLPSVATFDEPASAAAASTRSSTGAAASISAPSATGQGVSLRLTPDRALAEHRYSQSEWFASGDARSFAPVGATRKNGRWAVKPALTSTYRTRIVSYVPKPSRFNGTVIVEWLNVTAGFDLANDLAFLSPEVERSGYAWVGVSAQLVGVANLRSGDPARYASLQHPGDAYALDIFSQVGRALRRGDVPPVRALHPRRYLAVGQSQSAFALTTYINAIQPTAHVFDGFFVHSRGGGALRLDGISVANSFSAGAVRFRTDTEVPVLVFETETDEQIGNYAGARQPDTRTIRLWDVAGSSHEDSFRVPSAAAVGCAGRVNEAPTHFVAESALHRLDQWVHTHRPPPSAPRLLVQRTANGPIVQRDRRGVAVGGIRTAATDVPVAAYSGIGTDHSSTTCELIGDTRPFTDAELRHLYPSAAKYVAAVRTATARAIESGYLLRVDRAAIIATARHAAA